MVSTEWLAGLLAADFYECGLDLSLRRSPPASATWDSMPEVDAARQLRTQGASDYAVRVFLTFIAAMDRARDATTLWHAGVMLFGSHPGVFDTRRAAGLPLSQVSHLLANSGVSQRHGPDARAWHRIAESLATGAASPVHEVIHRGAGDAHELLKDVKTKDHAGPRFPMLRGPKIGPMWVRMLAEPGGAAITRIDTIPVAVDVHVRRVTENLRVTDTQGLRFTETSRGSSPHGRTRSFRLSSPARLGLRARVRRSIRHYGRSANTAVATARQWAGACRSVAHATTANFVHRSCGQSGFMAQSDCQRSGGGEGEEACRRRSIRFGAPSSRGRTSAPP